MIKETVNTILARLDERVKNFIDINGKEHVEIVKKIDDLCVHVNEEHKTYDSRLTALEDVGKADIVQAKQRARIYKALGTVISVIVSIATALHFMGVF